MLSWHPKAFMAERLGRRTWETSGKNRPYRNLWPANRSQPFTDHVSYTWLEFTRMRMAILNAVLFSNVVVNEGSTPKSTGSKKLMALKNINTTIYKLEPASDKLSRNYSRTQRWLKLKATPKGRNEVATPSKTSY